MRIKYILTALITFTGLILTAQSAFEKTFGGPYWDAGYAVLQTKDGGFVFTGYRNVFAAEGTQMYLIKTDMNGNVQWDKSYKGDLTSSDPSTSGTALISTSDNGYVIVGYKSSYPNRFYFIKTDANGDSLIGKTYGQPFWPETANSVKQTSDGGYIIAGNSSEHTSQLKLVKTDAQGDELWSKYYGPDPGAGDTHSIVQTSDGGYAMLAYIESAEGSGVSDIYLFKLDSNGDQLWTKKYGGSNDDVAYCIQTTPDDGFIIAATTRSYGAGGYDMYIIKTNSTGDVSWTKTFGGLDNEWANSIALTSDGGYIIAGSTESFSKGGYDAYLVKIDAMGNEEWSSNLGGLRDDYGYGVQQTVDGGYIMVGIRGYDMYLVKTNGKGNVVTEINVEGLDSKINVYPNPFSAETTFRTKDNLKNARLGIYNTLGQEIKSVENISGEEYKLSRNDLQSGIYFYRLTQDDKIISMNKLVITD